MPDAGVHPNVNVLKWNKLLASGGWWHSFELPDGRVLEGVNPLFSLRDRIGQFPIAQDLRGKRVLDIGAWDGWFSLEMERRGAEVVAIDCWDNERFRYLMRVFDSKIDYRIVDLFELTPQRFGTFDVVLFMGVLYHLKHPVLGLERACAMSHDFVAVDSFVTNDALEIPVMEFYERDEFGGQFDNWIGPNVPAMLAMCRTAGFARVELLNRIEHSACVACYRKWLEPPSDAADAPALQRVFHHTNFGSNFYSHRDEYATAVFTGPENLRIDDVMPQVSGFGSRPISLASVDGEWYSNFKVPLGLKPGQHDVLVRTAASQWSNPCQVLIDVSPESGGLRMKGITDGKTWEDGIAHIKSADGTDGVLSLWVEGLPPNADRGNIVVKIDSIPAQIQYVEPLGALGKRQINARIPSFLEPGAVRVEVSCGNARTETRVSLR